MDFKGLLSFLELKALRKKIKGLGKEDFTIEKNIPSLNLEVPNRAGRARLFWNATDSVNLGVQLEGETSKLVMSDTDQALRFQPDKTKSTNHEVLHKGNVPTPSFQTYNEVAGCWIHPSANFPTLYDDNTWRRLNLNSILRNNKGWEYMNFRYVVPTSGLYHMEARVYWKNCTQGSRLGLRLVNQDGVFTNLQDTRVYYNDKYQIGGSTIVWLEAGDLITVEYVCDGTDGTIFTESASTFFKCVHLN